MLLVVGCWLLVNFFAYLIALLINLLRTYPCSVFDGEIPSAIMNVAALMWSAMIRNCFLFSLYDLFVSFSICLIIGCQQSVR